MGCFSSAIPHYVLTYNLSTLYSMKLDQTHKLNVQVESGAKVYNSDHIYVNKKKVHTWVNSTKCVVMF